MLRQRLLIIIVIVVVVAAAALLGYGFLFNNGQSAEAAASAVVTAFGERLNTVSLLAPDASSTIATQYEPYVTPELLTAWEADPQQAPGRLTSSPWPDHIQIDSVVSQGASYIVNGEVVLMTSEEVEKGGNAGLVPVVIQVVSQDGKWLIGAYQEQTTSS